MYSVEEDYCHAFRGRINEFMYQKNIVALAEQVWNTVADRLHLSEKIRQTVGEVIRFGMVGVLATLIQYLVYVVCIHFMGPSLSLTIGYIISFMFNFYASTHFTFRVEANVKHGAGFALSHGINYTLQMITLNLFLWLGVPKGLAPIPMYCICIPVNFTLVRFFLKR